MNPASPNDTLQTFAHDVCAGLRRPQKAISSRWLYDDTGSALFEQITHLPSYYLTRTEMAILSARCPQLAERIGPNATVVEYGAGALRKTRLLLDALAAPRRYIPIDIAADFLKQSVAELAAVYPQLPIHPVTGNFLSDTLDLGLAAPDGPRLGFFPGSTIGNLSNEEIATFLCACREELGAGAAFVLGIDLKKDPARLLPAYDDSEGVTAAFNLNLLVRINRELNGTFDLERFHHQARWNEEAGRVEMHLVCDRGQEVMVNGERFEFRAGESIHTENSRKFTLSGLAALIEPNGWSLAQHWCDEEALFAVVLLDAR